MALHPTSPKPVISVIMANYNCEAYLAGAIKTVLGQTLEAIELILVDDGSSDGSVELANSIARQDPRLRVFSGKRYGGPAPVRNFALEQAQGDWIAIVDSDDLIRSDRLQRMLAAAETTGADIMIDNLAVFQSDGPSQVTTMFEGDLALQPARIMESEYIKANTLYGRGSKLGYAKPLIRRSALDKYSVRYNEKLRIGEDYEMIVRLLAAGCRMMSIPDVMYFYRKHGQSISHRLDGQSLAALQEVAAEALRQPTPHAEVTAAHAARLRSINRAVAFDHILVALKRMNLFGALRQLSENPNVIPLLRLPVLYRLQRVFGNPFARSDRALETELDQLRVQCNA